MTSSLDNLAQSLASALPRDTAPGRRRARRARRSVTVQAQNVNVQPSHRQRERRARDRNPRAANSALTLQRSATMPESAGRITVDGIKHNVLGDCINPSEGAAGWFYKYLDPAGSVESGRAIGEFTKIPDGLLRFSVDAEQRPIVTEECPGVSGSAIPLDGELWSISFFSFPAFRLNYIALANTNNEVVTPDVAADFLSVLNNITDWRVKADGAWRLFRPAWYYKIRVLPNTFQMAEAGGRTDSVTEFRKTAKGITFEFNAPTLVDQGWWVGGHVPIKPRTLTVPIGEASEATFSIHVDSFLGNEALRFNVSVTGQTIADPVLTGPGTLLAAVDTEFVVAGGAADTTITRVTPIELRLNEAVWAAAGATLTLRVTSFASGVATFTYTSSTAGSPTINLGPFNNAVRRRNVVFQTDVEVAAFNKLSLMMPAMTSDELTTNNPKIEQFLCKDSGGAYIVHYKMSNPVFEMTGEEAYGFFEFHYPGYDADDVTGARGIRDTFERNFTSAVVHFWGISKSASIVAKTYDGWEGTTNSGTVVGQFAHTGAAEEAEVVELANVLQTELTGVYPADDNFAALVASLASTALGGLLKSTATPSVVKTLAHKALGVVSENPAAVENTVKAIGNVGSRLVRAIKDRRARRRARLQR